MTKNMKCVIYKLILNIIVIYILLTIMKLKFKRQQYQIDATNAIVNIFNWQTKWNRKIIWDRWQKWNSMFVEELFSNKKLEITDDQLLENIKQVQKSQWLTQSKELHWNNFTVEMETGTGKTYVYTNSIYELNKHYGWNKFIIMVPSIAIREWVKKSLEITSEHFFELYWQKIRFFIYDTKNKSNLVNIKNFWNSANIEVIIMNYQAFATNSKDSRKIFQSLDQINSHKPIDLIKKTNPILIIDEPQRFWEKAEKTMSDFNPLFTLRFSATHKKDYNKIYRLDAIDAYNSKLVKRINVKWIDVSWSVWTNSFLFLDRISISAKSYPKAFVKMEIEVKQESWIKRTIRQIKEYDNLYELSNELEQYKWFVVKEINWKDNKVSFTNWVEIYVWQAIWDVDESYLRRVQIRETIRSHIEKEKIMFDKWIKVLSLFFIDEVAKYRQYDESNNDMLWEYAEMFEEEYKQIMSEADLFNEQYKKYISKFNVKDIHKWYFSIDKKNKRFVNSNEKKWEEWGSDDQSAYDLIMKNKEKLLDFEEPTRFIFSHSALREWWDNPNVFQICTLKHSSAEISRRQEIWRWLRICVNKNWERMDVNHLWSEFFDINTLTVIASESYETFAKWIQSEILESVWDRPIQFTTDVLLNRELINEKWEKYIFNNTSSMDLVFYFKNKWYINEKYEITEKLISDVEENNFELPTDLKWFENQIIKLSNEIYNTKNFKMISDDNANNIDEKILTPNKNFMKKEFQDLWWKINTITTYEVRFDSNELIEKSIMSINKNLEVNKVKVSINKWLQKDELNIDDLKKNTWFKRLDTQIQVTSSVLWNIWYDLIWEITKNTNLNRKTICAILQWIHKIKFELFMENPEDFIKKVSWLINDEKSTTLINNIIYHKTDKKYDTDIFTINNFKGSLKENIMFAKKHIYDYVKVDSDSPNSVERKFAEQLETWEVMVYAKLPRWFKIPTPIWSYNPDWAIVFDKENVKYVYFIAETKGSLNTLDLRPRERLKTRYAKKHFEALWHSDIKYDVINWYDDLVNKVFL